VDTADVLKPVANLLFFRQPLEVASDFSLEETIDRLSSQIDSSLSARLVGESAVGRIWGRQVWIQWGGECLPPNSFRPCFFGRFYDDEHVSLQGAFTLHVFTRVFLCFLYGSLAIFSLVGLATLIDDPWEGVQMCFGAGVMFAVIYGIARFANYASAHHIDHVTELIRSVLIESDEAFR
jgi:hypothetical protein